MLSLMEIRRPSTVDLGVPVQLAPRSVTVAGQMGLGFEAPTLFAAAVCLLHAVQPLAPAWQGGYEGIEPVCILVSNASLRLA